MAAVCQADKLNQKLNTPINFTGIINFAIQNYSNYDQIGQYAALELQKNDLYFNENGDSLSNYNIDNFAGYMGLTSSGINRINAEVSAGFAMPFINPGTLDQLDPEDNFAIFSAVENRTLFSVRDSIVYSNNNVIIKLMKAYNLTLAANIYENNVLGQIGQQSIQVYQSLYSKPIFACNSILTNQILSDTEYYVNFCRYVDGINYLKVIKCFEHTQLNFVYLSL